MEIEIKDLDKRVSVWLTRAESHDAGLKEALKPLYKAYKAKRYLVAVYESGEDDLTDLTRELLLYNRVRLRELEKARENV